MFDVMINGIPLIAVVLALVEWVKGFGVSGSTLRVVSMLIGVALGGAYMYSTAVPADFAGWLGLVVYGLALGLSASGLFDAAKSVGNKS